MQNAPVALLHCSKCSAAVTVNVTLPEQLRELMIHAEQSRIPLVFYFSAEALVRWNTSVNASAQTAKATRLLCWMRE